ncbi:ubiquitin-protein ligase molybdopterin-converting factor [Xylariomycetidae sp. FL0641]|nr:ubiquitin-protein ligase molybdopterin-converting factor [Xylariomycetidae sp. FL0641]
MATSSLIERASSNTRVQFAATALASGAVVAGAILGYQRLRHEERISELKDSIPLVASGDDETRKLDRYGGASPPIPLSDEDKRDQALARRAQEGELEQELSELLEHQLTRTASFLGEAGMARLRESFVVVVGCGGVGSHCAAALARNGVSRLRLVDFDLVSLSSLNRHALATQEDVATPKVVCMQRRLHAVAPWVKFDLHNDTFELAKADHLLAPWNGQKPDYVVDAIDNVIRKADLLKYCRTHQIPVIASMGAGCKSDPTRIIVGDISTTNVDPLAKTTRRELRQGPESITDGIPTVFSTEEGGAGKAELLPLPEEEFAKGKVDELAPQKDFRVRILPVLGTMPSIFGLTAANYIILSLAGYPHVYTAAKSSTKTHHQMKADLHNREGRLLRHMTGGDGHALDGMKTPYAPSDMAFLAEEIYKGRSAITGITTELRLVRWQRPTSSTLVQIGEQKSYNVKLEDLVCMTKEEAQVHEEQILRGDKNPEDLYDQEVLERVERLRKETAWWEKHC